MDLELVARAAHVLGKAVGLGLTAWTAAEAPPFSSEDWSLLKELAEAAGALAPQKPAPPPPARHTALIAAAFGEAWRQHWALGARPRGELAVQWRDYFFSAGPQRELLAEASKRLQAALVERPPEAAVLRAAEALELEAESAGEVLNTPAYRALFAAFTGEGPDGEPPLLPLAPSERVVFERRVLRAYHEGLAAPAGAEVRAWQLGLVHDRALLVRQLLLADSAAWGARHVFGNALQHESLPALPLDGLYVEPQAEASWQAGARKQRLGPRAAQNLIAQLSAKHPVVLVVADFGLGKSLTARKRAAALAQAYLAGEAPSPELELPVFIRCADDLAGGDVDLDRVIRRALQRHARELGLDLPLADAAFAPPSADVRACFILDGLDEVGLGERQLQELLRGLRDRAGGKHRFVLFSRPAALPVSAHGAEVPRVRLREFTTAGRDKQPGGQVGEWLERWNALRPDQPPLSVQELARHKLLDLAATPILLFMIAFTWSPKEGGAVSQVELFERFFRQVARGKHELDLSTHPQIAAASERVRDALLARGIVPPGATPVDAMLWLLGRAAWESLRRAEQGEALAAFHVERIVREELGVAEGAEAVRSIRTSLLLVLQADLDGGEGRILFGHRSFEEFLVARHWAGVLRRIAAGSSHTWREQEHALTGARLLEPGGKAPEFLLKLLFSWDDAERHRVLEWAAWSFNEERLPEGAASFAEDPRAHVREAALFVGSMLPESHGLAARTALTLRSLLAWFWLRGKQPNLQATRLRSPEARLEGADLTGARLDHADLRRAHLDGATLQGAWLYRADLSAAKLNGAMAMNAQLEEANLEDALLRDAFLSGASLRRARLARAVMPLLKAGGADFERADLSRAILKSAHLEKALLRGASLVMADLDRAKLGGADLTAADLSRAALHGADLKRAVLAQANLQDADLRDAKLREADLRGADLRRANLSGADLEGADLHGADLRDAILDGARRPDFTGAQR